MPLTLKSMHSDGQVRRTEGGTAILSPSEAASVGITPPLLESVARLIAPWGPPLPTAQMVEQINLLYHAAEAESYDQQHPEIFEQLPPAWREMCEMARGHVPSGGLRVLDFGCG